MSRRLPLRRAASLGWRSRSSSAGLRVEWLDRETGAASELSTAAVNSALQRARERLARIHDSIART